MKDNSPKISLHILIKEFYNRNINLVIEKVEDVSEGCTYNWITIKDLKDQLDMYNEDEIWYGIDHGKVIFVKGNLFKEIIETILSRTKTNENTLQTAA